MAKKIKNRLTKEALLGSLNKVEFSTSKHFLVRKTTRKLFGKGNKVETALQLIHLDIREAMNIKARHEEIYFITFIYDLSQYVYVYLISHKYQTLDILIKFMKLSENQLDIKIKVLRTDLGQESSALKVCYLFITSSIKLIRIKIILFQKFTQ